MAQEREIGRDRGVRQREKAAHKKGGDRNSPLWLNSVCQVIFLIFTHSVYLFIIYSVSGKCGTKCVTIFRTLSVLGKCNTKCVTIFRTLSVLGKCCTKCVSNFRFHRI